MKVPGNMFVQPAPRTKRAAATRLPATRAERLQCAARSTPSGPATGMGAGLCHAICAKSAQACAHHRHEPASIQATRARTPSTTVARSSSMIRRHVRPIAPPSAGWAGPAPGPTAGCRRDMQGHWGRPQGHPPDGPRPAVRGGASTPPASASAGMGAKQAGHNHNKCTKSAQACAHHGGVTPSHVDSHRPFRAAHLDETRPNERGAGPTDGPNGPREVPVLNGGTAAGPSKASRTCHGLLP